MMMVSQISMEVLYWDEIIVTIQCYSITRRRGCGGKKILSTEGQARVMISNQCNYQHGVQGLYVLIRHLDREDRTHGNP